MNRDEWDSLRLSAYQNGSHAYKWAAKVHGEALIDRIMHLRLEQDWLAERADIVAYCRREGLVCTPRHTRQLKPRTLFGPTT